MTTRLVFALSCIALGSGCTTIEHGTFKYASVGGNLKGLRTPEGMVIEQIDNATGAMIAREAIGDAASAWAMGKAFDAAGKLVEEGFDALSDSNETDVKINASNNAAKVKTETFVPPPAPIE